MGFAIGPLGGGVIVGDVPSWRVDNMPYGGVNHSGLGREGLRRAIEDMTENASAGDPGLSVILLVRPPRC